MHFLYKRERKRGVTTESGQFHSKLKCVQPRGALELAKLQQMLREGSGLSKCDSGGEYSQQAAQIISSPSFENLCISL